MFAIKHHFEINTFDSDAALVEVCSKQRDLRYRCSTPKSICALILVLFFDAFAHHRHLPLSRYPYFEVGSEDIPRSRFNLITTDSRTGNWIPEDSRYQRNIITMKNRVSQTMSSDILVGEFLQISCLIKISETVVKFPLRLHV